MMRGLQFSRRTEWDLGINRLAERLAARIRHGEEILDLAESNPTRAGLAYPQEEIARALADPRALAYNPDPRGMRSAREAVAAWYARRGRTVDPNQIVLCASTSEAYAWLFKVLCESGDEVLVPVPSYPLFDFLAKAEDARLGAYPLEYDGSWVLHPEEIRARTSPRTRAAIVVQPNNPTGSVLSPEEFRSFGAACADLGLALISDEVFADYPFEGTPGSMASALDLSGPLTFTLGGLSKAVGLPQMKLSWIVTAGPAKERNEALARLDVLGDTFLSVNTPVQAGLGKLLEAGESVARQIRERVTGNHALLRLARREDAVWDCLTADGGWTAVLSVPRIMTDEEWALLLLERDGVYLHPGRFFDFATDGFLVVSLLPQRELFLEGVRRVVARIESEAAGARGSTD